MFRPRFMCRLGFRWNPRFCADLHYSGNGVLSRRGRGAHLAVSLASLTSRVPVQQPCRRSNHQLGFLAGSFVRAPDAPPWSRPLPIPVPISARLLHGQGFHGFPPTSDPAPTRVPPALVSALLPVHWNRSVNLCRPGVSGLVSPTYAYGRTKLGSFWALCPDMFPSSPVPTSAYQLRTFVSWLAQSLSAASVDVSLAAVRSYRMDWG